MKKEIKNKQEKGITLIALVVTIVVLLILAGVSISLVLNNNGVISKAKDARDKYAEAQTNDEKQLNEVSDWIKETVGDTNLPATTKPYMPGDTFTVVAGTTLDNGLTIQDAAKNGNEYVWVEVPMTTEVYPTAGLNITKFTTDEYTKIEADLHTYTMPYRKGKNTTETDFKDEWYADLDNNWYTSEQYTAQKQKMLKSVYQNGGFWVAKYEAGLTEENKRTDETPAPTIAPQSKQNLIPYTWVTRTQAKKLAEMVQYTNNGTTYTGSLMFGVQWDLVLKFIETKKIKTVSDIETKLNSDSKDIGNYYNATFTINRGKYAKYKALTTWYNYTDNLEGIVSGSVKSAQSSNENGILLTTGAVDQNSLMNIYDLAGNVEEWTLESATFFDDPCAYRGGCYCSYGSSSPASGRNYGVNTIFSNNMFGFRLSLY